MLEKKYNYINGNIVEKPLRREETFEERRKREQSERAKREKRKKLKKKQVKERMAIVQVASVFLILGVVTIMRDGQVYNMQRDLSKMGSEMKVLSAEGEALKVSLLKGASLESIEKDATNKLGMVTATKNDVIFMDTSEDFLGELKAKEVEMEQINSEKGFFSKIFGMFN
ncbi:MAG: cell division protein FtsL [Clostridium sp.]